MPGALHTTLVALLLTFVAAGGYYRIQSQRSGERLDRTKEGWPILIGIRLFGLLAVGCTVTWFWQPALFTWASYPVGTGARWLGVDCLACSIAWLLWMFHTLGRNLTDTVVTRRGAHLVQHGPYRFVRNPMYCGILMLGISLGLALGTWLLPVLAGLMFTLWALRTRTEEKYLIDRFGDQYLDYMQRVGRFFPKLPRSRRLHVR